MQPLDVIYIGSEYIPPLDKFSVCASGLNGTQAMATYDALTNAIDPPFTNGGITAGNGSDADFQAGGSHIYFSKVGVVAGTANPYIYDMLTRDLVNTPSLNALGGKGRYSRDGRFLATACVLGAGQPHRVYDALSNYSELHSASDSANSAIGGKPDFSPDGTWLATGKSNSLVIRNTSDFSIVQSINVTIGNIQCVRFSPDGSKLYVAGSSAPFILTFETVSWTPITSPVVPGVATSVDASLDGDWIAVSSQSTPYVSAYRTSTLIRSTPATQPTQQALSVAFSPDSSTLLAGSLADGVTTCLRKYVVGSFGNLAAPNILVAVRNVAFSP